MMLRPSRRAILATVMAALACAAPAAARADGDGDRAEARVGGHCSTGTTSRLRLRAYDGAIRVEFEVRRRRAGERWRVVIVQERRVAARASVRTSGSGGGFRVRRWLRDLDGPDRITARASGPRGMACEASATLAG